MRKKLHLLSEALVTLSHYLLCYYLKEIRLTKAKGDQSVAERKRGLVHNFSCDTSYIQDNAQLKFISISTVIKQDSLGNKGQNKSQITYSEDHFTINFLHSNVSQRGYEAISGTD